MKKGKIILGAASLVITAVGAFAFKSASKFNANRVFATVSGSPNATCFTTTCFKTASGSVTRANCVHTRVANAVPGLTTWYTQKTSGVCGNVYAVGSLVTRVQ